jgi:hypothetical protein
LLQTPAVVITIRDGVIDSVYFDAEKKEIVVVDAEGNKNTYKQPTTSDSTKKPMPVVLVDSQQNTYTIDKDGKVAKINSGSGATTAAGNTGNTTTKQREHIKALALDIAKTFRKELGAFLNLPLNTPKLGAGPISADIYAAIPPCMKEYENDRTALRAIFDYTGELQSNTTLQDQLVALLEKDGRYTEIITRNQSVFEKNSSGFDQKLSAEDWNNAKNESCEHQVAEAKTLYISDYLNTTGVNGDCFTRGLVKGLLTYSWQAAPLVALVETGLCLTEKDKCAGEGYWTQFSYGATNALLQELDIISIADGVVMLIGSQLKNKFECIIRGGSITVIITASTVEEGLHMFSKCVIGIDMTLEEWKAMYGKVKDYVAANWTDPYLHGQATVFVATLIIPFTKISALSKVKLLNKFKTSSKLSEFGSKIDELEKLSKVADEGGDIGKVVDEFTEAKHADEIIDVAKATEKQLDDVYARISKDPPYDYAPNTIEHKAERWAQYKELKGDLAKDYQTWSNIYNSNMTKATRAHQVADEYRKTIGWGKREVTVTAGGQTRRLDIADKARQKAVEIKSYETGTVYGTEAIRTEVAADRILVSEGWAIEWVFKDCAPSGPLKKLLDDASVIITLVP